MTGAAGNAADPSPPHATRRPVQGDTPAARRDVGRAARSEVALSDHGEWATPANRPDPVALLVEQGRTRVPDLVPIRYGRMLVSPFTFLRGAALVMAADLARLPSSGLYVQACGDAHISNFGVFATPERRLSFDVNDFDETHPAPFEWDVKRLAASTVVATKGVGYPAAARRRITRSAVEAYRTEMRRLSEMSFLDGWYERVDMTETIAEIQRSGSSREKKRVESALKKASTETNLGSLSRLAERTATGWRLREKPPLIVRYEATPERQAVLQKGFDGYRRSLGRHLQPIVQAYRFADFARKVVGVGSVGTEAFVFLTIGIRKNDALFLQVKEAQPSVLERYTEASTIKHNGERVVTGQKLMQASSDQLLGWMNIAGLGRPYDYYVRQLRDWKASLEVVGGDEKRVTLYARTCAMALAKAHARSGSAVAISGYLGKSDAFESAIEAFAVGYAAQTERDHKALLQAEADGRIEVRHGV